MWSEVCSGACLTTPSSDVTVYCCIPEYTSASLQRDQQKQNFQLMLSCYLTNLICEEYGNIGNLNNQKTISFVKELKIQYSVAVLSLTAKSKQVHYCMLA